MGGPSDQKAGLLRDPEEVKQIIWEASKGSKYFLVSPPPRTQRSSAHLCDWQDQQRRDEELTVKVNKLTHHLDSLVQQRGNDLRAEEALVDQKLAAYERKRDLSQTIVVVECVFLLPAESVLTCLYCSCDAFYASCETKADPSRLFASRRSPSSFGTDLLVDSCGESFRSGVWCSHDSFVRGEEVRMSLR